VPPAGAARLPGAGVSPPPQHQSPWYPCFPPPGLSQFLLATHESRYHRLGTLLSVVSKE
jgi:hypothetical protein